MLNILACFKWVIDEADIKVDLNSRKLLMDRVSWKLSEYDRNAIEEAALLRDKYGGSVTAVTVGPPSAKQSLKDVLSRGSDKALFIHDTSFEDLEPAQTAAILAAAISKRTEYDLVICGEGSSDLYAQQVGPALAERLEIPAITYAGKLTFVPEEKTVIAERRLEECVETVAVQLPALVTVLPGINTPRIPGLKQVLGSARKPVENVALEDLGQTFEPRLQTISVHGATMERRRRMFGAGTEDIKAVVEALLKDGVLA